MFVEKDFLKNFLEENNIKNKSYLEIKHKIKKRPNPYETWTELMFILNDKYFIGRVILDETSIRSVLTLNKYLRESKLPTIKNLWYNIIKNCITENFKSNKVITVKQVAKRALWFWEKVVINLQKEWIIKKYKFEKYPDKSFKDLQNSEKTFLWDLILLKE